MLPDSIETPIKSRSSGSYFTANKGWATAVAAWLAAAFLSLSVSYAAPATSRPSAAARKPVVLVFDVNAGTGADADFVAQASRETRDFLRETDRVDAVRYDKDSPVVQRALLEKSVSAEEAASPSTPELRTKLAKLFGVQYFTGGDVSVTGSSVDLALSLTEIVGGRKWVSQQRVTASSDQKRDLANARASAIRTAVMQIAQDAFSGLAAVDTEEPAAGGAAPPPMGPPLNLDEKVYADRMARADRYIKEGNTAAAITELKRAINANPKVLEPRVKLANLLSQQKKFDQAVDELKRAHDLAPDDDEVTAALAAAYEAQGSPDEALKLYAELMSKQDTPKTAALRLKLGDLYWKHAKVESAIAQYRAAVEADAKDPTPHLRLARVHAARADFVESAKEIDEAAKLTPEGQPVIDSETFQSFLKIVDSEIRAIYAQYQAGDSAFRGGERTHEEFNDSLRELADRSAALSDFLGKLPAPDKFRASKRHRVLGLALFSQGFSTLMTFVRTNDDAARTESSVLLTEAVKELQTAFDLDKKTISKES